MKHVFTLLLCLVFGCTINAQTNVFPSTGSAGIGTIVPNSSSLLEMQSTNQGFLTPRMTQAQRNAIVAPATGLLIYQTNGQPGFYYYNGASWTAVSSSNGANRTLSNLNPTAINLSLNPGSDNLYDLGSSAFSWNDVHAQGNSFLGNVSINTTSTESELTLNGIDEVMTIDGTDPFISFENGGTDIGYLRANENDLTLATYITNDSGRIVLRANGLESLFVHPSGQVSVNTSLPVTGYEFNVNGDIYASSQLAVGTATADHVLTVEGTDEVVTIRGVNPYLQFEQSAADIGYVRALSDDLKISTNLANTSGRLLLGTQSSDELFIHPTGEVTINNVSPYTNYELGINGDLYISSQLAIGTTAADATAQLTLSGTEDVVIIDGTDPFVTWRDNSEDLGYIQALNEDIRIGIFAANTDGKIIFASNSTTRMFIDHDGNVVMGGLSTTPKSGYKLNVDGRIVCEELRVEIYPWADYVFDKNYNLMPLNELEEYINTHKHLPNIPTATEIESNGLQIGEMQAKTMEKIEELTLYIIALKKQNDMLAEKISILENK